MILGEDRYVCQVGISNIGDLLLGPVDSSCELSYFGLLYSSTKELIPLWEVDIMSDIEISLDGEGQGMEDVNSLDLGYIEDISEV